MYLFYLIICLYIDNLFLFFTVVLRYENINSHAESGVGMDIWKREAVPVEEIWFS